jgi:hypothetical protein
LVYGCHLDGDGGLGADRSGARTDPDDLDVVCPGDDEGVVVFPEKGRAEELCSR